MNFRKHLTLRFGKNAESDILFSSLSLEFKISLRTALRNLTCIPTVSEIYGAPTVHSICSMFFCICIPTQKHAIERKSK